MRTRESELAHLKEIYALGWISVAELEARVAEVLASGWTPLGNVTAVLKDLYSQ